MKFIRRLLLTSIAVFGLAYFLPGISVVNFKDALLVALVLGFVRAIVQPILVFLTLPITILTLGLFLIGDKCVHGTISRCIIGWFLGCKFWICIIV